MRTLFCDFGECSPVRQFESESPRTPELVVESNFTLDNLLRPAVVASAGVSTHSGKRSYQSVSNVIVLQPKQKPIETSAPPPPPPSMPVQRPHVKPVQSSGQRQFDTPLMKELLDGSEDEFWGARKTVGKQRKKAAVESDSSSEDARISKLELVKKAKKKAKTAVESDGSSEDARMLKREQKQQKKRAKATTPESDSSSEDSPQASKREPEQKQPKKKAKVPVSECDHEPPTLKQEPEQKQSKKRERPKKNVQVPGTKNEKMEKSPKELQRKESGEENVLISDSDEKADRAKKKIDEKGRPDQRATETEVRSATIRQPESSSTDPKMVPNPPPEDNVSSGVEFQSLCNECDDGGVLFGCVTCSKVWHKKCARKKFGQFPGKNDDWACVDCKKGQHQCFMCTDYFWSTGPQKSMSQCRRKNCGNFYCSKCQPELEIKVCPWHVCAKCDAVESDANPLMRCIRCPLAYHDSCRPEKAYEFKDDGIYDRIYCDVCADSTEVQEKMLPILALRAQLASFTPTKMTKGSKKKKR